MNKNTRVAAFKIEMFSGIASTNNEQLQWRERANTQGFESIQEARAFMSKNCPNAPFIPYGDSNNAIKVRKVYGRGTPYRVVF